MSKLIRINDKLMLELDKVAGNTYNDKIAWLLGYNSDSRNEFDIPSKQIVNSKQVVNKLTDSIQDVSILAVNKLTDELTNSKQNKDSKLSVNKDSKLTVNNKQEVNPWLTHKVRTK